MDYNFYARNLYSQKTIDDHLYNDNDQKEKTRIGRKADITTGLLRYDY